MEMRQALRPNTLNVNVNVNFNVNVTAAWKEFDSPSGQSRKTPPCKPGDCQYSGLRAGVSTGGRSR